MIQEFLIYHIPTRRLVKASYIRNIYLEFGDRSRFIFPDIEHPLTMEEASEFIPGAMVSERTYSFYEVMLGPEFVRLPAFTQEAEDLIYRMLAMTKSTAEALGLIDMVMHKQAIEFIANKFSREIWEEHGQKLIDSLDLRFNK